MDEQSIRKLYVEKPDEEVRLLCSYTTRKEGFLDVLLSGSLLSSEEARKLLGTIKTHRGSSMTSGGRESYYNANHHISFSTGFVSFKYSDPSLRAREDYVGGLGVLVPLERILEHPHLGFSHCSDVGGIENYDLNKSNIIPAVHMARKQGVLYDDGYGNIFEVALWPELQKDDSSSFPRVITYPRLALAGDVVVAIPESERGTIESDVRKKQEEYKRFLDKIAGQNPEELQWKTIDGRDLFYVKEMVPFMEGLVKPFEIDKLPIVWYKDRNLDVALERLAISQND